MHNFQFIRFLLSRFLHSRMSSYASHRNHEFAYSLDALSQFGTQWQAISTFQAILIWYPAPDRILLPNCLKLTFWINLLPRASTRHTKVLDQIDELEDGDDSDVHPEFQMFYISCSTVIAGWSSRMRLDWEGKRSLTLAKFSSINRVDSRRSLMISSLALPISADMFE